MNVFWFDHTDIEIIPDGPSPALYRIKRACPSGRWPEGQIGTAVPDTEPMHAGESGVWLTWMESHMPSIANVTESPVTYWFKWEEVQEFDPLAITADCPYCGASKGMAPKEDKIAYAGPCNKFVVCRCGAAGPNHRTFEEAIAAWNKREVKPLIVNAWIIRLRELAVQSAWLIKGNKAASDKVLQLAAMLWCKEGDLP